MAWSDRASLCTYTPLLIPLNFSGATIFFLIPTYQIHLRRIMRSSIRMSRMIGRISSNWMDLAKSCNPRCWIREARPVRRAFVDRLTFWFWSKQTSLNLCCQWLMPIILMNHVELCWKFLAIVEKFSRRNLCQYVAIGHVPKICADNSAWSYLCRCRMSPARLISAPSSVSCSGASTSFNLCLDLLFVMILMDSVDPFWHIHHTSRSQSERSSWMLELQEITLPSLVAIEDFAYESTEDRYFRGQTFELGKHQVTLLRPSVPSFMILSWIRRPQNRIRLKFARSDAVWKFNRVWSASSESCDPKGKKGNRE
jgi:hypothetical protein